MQTVVDISHFYITWKITEQFSHKHLKPMAFLVYIRTTSVFVWRNDILFVSLKSGAYYITDQCEEFIKKCYLMHLCFFFGIFLLFFIRKLVFLSFSFLFFGKVSNFRNRILNNQKVVSNCQWNCMATSTSARSPLANVQHASSNHPFREWQFSIHWSYKCWRPLAVYPTLSTLSSYTFSPDCRLPEPEFWCSLFWMLDAMPWEVHSSIDNFNETVGNANRVVGLSVFVSMIYSWPFPTFWCSTPQVFWIVLCQWYSMFHCHTHFSFI